MLWLRLLFRFRRRGGGPYLGTPGHFLGFGQRRGWLLLARLGVRYDVTWREKNIDNQEDRLSALTFRDRVEAGAGTVGGV